MLNTLPKSLIEVATRLLESAPKYPETPMIKKILGSGRYDITGHTESYNGHDLVVNAKKPAGAVDFFHRSPRPEVSWHDPEISNLVTPHPDEQFPRTYAELKPESGYHSEVQEKMTPGVIYRGMSAEEFENVKKTGQIKSKGDYNLEGQEQLTYYSKNPSQAASYAHGFAPLEHRASGVHKAYVVAVKDPGTGVDVPGTGEHEVGIPHPIHASDILHVHEGRMFASTPGSFSTEKSWSGEHSDASSSHPSSSMAWKKINF